MRAIVVDDESIMIRQFMRLSAGIPDLNVVAQFEDPGEAISYVMNNPIELAILDVHLPCMDGIKLAEKLREMQPKLLIVFISAYDEYVGRCNQIGGDYYILKPYKRKTLEKMMDNMRLLVRRCQKNIYIQMFGRFNVLVDGKPIRMSGKTKEILAIVASRAGKEVSNQEAYRTIWEDRTYTNENMKVYYNAVRRLKQILADASIGDLLIPTSRGQMLNMAICSGDYFSWIDNGRGKTEHFNGQFLPEYSWAEEMLAEMMDI